MTQPEHPLDVLDELLKLYQDERWDRWTRGTAAEYRAKLDADAKAWRDRMEKAIAGLPTNEDSA